MTLLLLTSACVVNTDKPGDDTAEPQVVSRLLMEGAFELSLARESLCALDEAGALHCWGPDASQFEALPDGTGHTDLTVVDGGGCVLSEGLVDCWGGVPEPTENEGFTQASVAGASCGVRANDILCWDGFNDDTTPWAGALQVAAPSDIVQCAIFPGEGVRCGELFSSAALTPLLMTGDFHEIDVGHGLCVVDATNELWCTYLYTTEEAVAVRSEALNVQNVTSYYALNHHCWITDGRPVCDESENRYEFDMRVLAPLAPDGEYIQIVFNEFLMCGISTASELLCWTAPEYQPFLDDIADAPAR